MVLRPAPLRYDGHASSGTWGGDEGDCPSQVRSPDDLKFDEVDEPRVGADDVLVRVRAASVHPDVWHVVSGRPFVLRLMGAGLSKPKNPIPGTDMAGIVESVGKNVTRFRPGDEVFGETIGAHQWTNGGAYSEYVSVRENWLAQKPDNVTFAQAASVPTSGFIALQNLRGASHRWQGQKVLVNGAGGGVGAVALQVAKACGAHVTGVDSTRKLGLLRALGADHVIDRDGLALRRQAGKTQWPSSGNSSKRGRSHRSSTPYIR